MSRREEAIDLTSDTDDNDASSEDEEIKQAIELSLRDRQTPYKAATPVLSKENPAPAVDEKIPRLKGNKEKSEPAATSQTNETVDNKPSVPATLDRKQMEAERLARLKRKRGEDTIEDRTISPPPMRRTIPLAPAEPDTQPTTKYARQIPFKQTSLPYAEGRIFLTSLERSRPEANTISMPDLLKPPDATFSCKSVLLSTFVSDFDWLFPHFATRSVSFMLVLHAANPGHKQLLTGDFAGIPNVRLVFPRVGGLINCMHSKLMLLFYEHSGSHGGTCRVVVPTANLTPADWGVRGVMENAVFVVDLPQDKSKTSTTGAFKSNLVQLLQAQDVPENVITKLNNFDFSQVNVGFIHSIGGSHKLSSQPLKTGINSFFTNSTSNPTTTTTSSNRLKETQNSALTFPASTRTALYSLSDTIKTIGLDIPSSHPLPTLDYITSSLGNLKLPFLQSLLLACCGRAPEIPINTMTRSGLPTIDQIKSNLRIYFPSDQTVQKSKGGPAAAGTICFQSKWWNAEGDFPKSSLRDCVGIRGDGVMMHSKILYVRFSKPRALAVGEWHDGSRRSTAIEGSKGTDEKVDTRKYYSGWAYIGSANLSESAWGTIIADSRTKQSKLNCRNWESGVLVPVQVTSTTQTLLDAGHNLHDMTLQQVFGGAVPVPIKEPAETYDDNRRPWFFDG